jgi:SAM-dependent methyltransferase
MANEKNRDHWNRSGTSWVTNQRAFDRMLRPLGNLVVSAAAPKSGERVLDVGCGFGPTARQVAAAGSIVHGVDISDPMIAEARRQVPKATFAVADAQTDDMGGPYDLIISRFGVMFFDDPLAAFRNLRRHASPHGRLAFVCWNDQLRSTAVWAGSEAIRAALPSPPPPLAPQAPGPFGLSDEEFTRNMLTAAGWQNVRIDGHELPCQIGWTEDDDDGVVSDGVEERVRVILASEMGQMMRDQIPSAQQPALVDAVRESLRARVSGGVLRLHASVWLVRATA